MADFDLLEYIKRVYGLEVLLYQQRFLKRKLNNRLKEVNNVSLQKTKPLISFDKKEYMTSSGWLFCLIVAPILVLAGILAGGFFDIRAFICSFVIFCLLGCVYYIYLLFGSKREALETERKNWEIASENKKIEESNKKRLKSPKIFLYR